MTIIEKEKPLKPLENRGKRNNNMINVINESKNVKILGIMAQRGKKIIRA